MKITGSTKASTKKIIAELDKASRKRKQDIWKTAAEILSKPRRRRISINLWKLEKLAKKNKGKTMLVLGKVLGYGTLESKIDVAALEFSESAKKELKGKGNFYTIPELLKKNAKPSDILIVK